MGSREERIETLKKELTNITTYNRPTYCAECGGVMVFKGVGEYQCEKCGYLDYDDYGKVRNYIEKHMGAMRRKPPRRPVSARKRSGIC